VRDPPLCRLIYGLDARLPVSSPARVGNSVALISQADRVFNVTEILENPKVLSRLNSLLHYMIDAAN
jgi:hypothetical protein